jgi:phosphoglycerate kinase
VGLFLQVKRFNIIDRKMKSIKDLNIDGKKVFIRCDFNVPLEKDGKIGDERRIKETLPTIEYALNKKAKVILASHLGRPKGKDLRYSLRPVAENLSRALKKKVLFVDDCIGEKVEKAVSSMKKGDVILLENLRFCEGERRDGEVFAKQLKKLFEVYISDAFGTSHRRNASVHALPRMCMEKAAGLLLLKEIGYWKKILKNPARPFVLILGGMKISTKLGALVNLLDHLDKVIIGSGMAIAFLNAMGFSAGLPPSDENSVEEAKFIISQATDKKIKLYLPIDFVVAERVEEDAITKIVPYQEIPCRWYIVDIGPASCKLFGEVLEDVATIVWNGPLGVYEIDKFARGTNSVAHQVALNPAMSIAGGGDTDSAIKKAKESDGITFISTGGGASLQFLEKETLPGIEALE